MTGANRQRIVVLLSVIVAVSAKAAPTLDSHDSKFITCSVSRSSDTHNVTLTEQNQITKLTDSHLYAIAGEFLKPPASLMGSSDTLSYAKSLPPVPGALLMTLVGFLCVSLVKDRRLWLAGFISLLWLGQAGFNTLPRLALHLISKRNIEQKHSSNVTYRHLLSELDRPRSDIEGTEYIGLLHYLEGIPATIRNTQYKHRVSSIDNRIASCVVRDAFPRLRWGQSHIIQTAQNKVRNTQYAIRNTNKIPQTAIIQILPEYILPTRCLAVNAEQFISFSPAFIFSCLARSPPKLA